MLINALCLATLTVGIFIIFSKNVNKSILISFLLSSIIFSVFLLHKKPLIGFVYLTIDSLVKFELFLFFTNKKINIKKYVFRKKNTFLKLGTAILAVMLTGISYVLLKGQGYRAELTNHNSDLLIISLIATLLIISGFIVRSQKWKN